MKRLTIIGAGNSLRGFDFNKIKGKIMVLSKVAFNVPRFDYVCALDEKWVKILNNYYGKKLHTTYKIKGSKVWKRVNTTDLVKGYVGTFESSLCFALNVAWNMKFKEIYVLGADNLIKDDYLYFWDNEKKPELCKNYNENLFKKIDNYMEIISKQMNNKVYFVESEIKHFENLTMQEYEKH